MFLLFSCNNGQVRFEANLAQEGKDISTQLIGAFFEDINYGADGGLYAELIQNRSFEYYEVPGIVNLEPMHAWQVLQEEGAKASMSIKSDQPLNSNNLHYLALEITNPGLAGIKNTGFDGIVLTAGSSYNYSVYVRSQKAFNNAVVIRILNENGVRIGEDTIPVITTEWKKYSGEITCTESTNAASLTLLTSGKGTLYFDMVSLFPKNTFMNRENGLREDLAAAIAGLHPKFLRFPGGCVSHGRGIENAYRWKQTLGDVAERKANFNLWGYHQTYGLGFYEYFQFCEDIGATPLPVIPVGISCQFRKREIVPMDKMQAWVDDALDLVEFANGDAGTIWGKKRAEMGHPEPFNMQYICLGNEEDDIPEFRERFKLISDALRARYPEIKIIGTSGTSSDGRQYDGLWDFSRQEELDAVDEHYYVDPNWLLANNHRYDDFDRNGPKVFIGEYASRDDRMTNAIAEASYLTGVERNGDVIQFTCYAPLLSNVNHQQWHPDLIRFNNSGISKTANYYVQQLFSTYSGNKYLNSSISYVKESDLFENIYQGKVGVGSWNTRVQFDDIKLVRDGKVAINEDFSGNPVNWEVLRGSFAAEEGVYKQNSMDQPAWSVMNEAVNASEYTYTLRARKTQGAEGFLIMFGLKSSQDYYWLNLGGWNNSLHAIEKGVGQGRLTMISIPGSIENDVWYDVKIEVNKSKASIYLNNVFLFDVPGPSNPVTASVVKNENTNEYIIKMVNSTDREIEINMNLTGAAINQEAKIISFTGEPGQKNTVESPDMLRPVEETFRVKNKFINTLPGNSLQIIVLPADRPGSLN